MRFTARTPIALFQVIVFATAAVSLSGSVAGQDTSSLGTPTPAAGATSSEANPQELLDKADAALKAGDYAAAVKAFNDAGRAIPPNDYDTRLKALTGRARALTGMKEYTTALNDLNTIISDADPNSPTVVPALNARGQLKLETNKPDEAVDDFEKAVQLDSGNVEALFGYGKSLVLLNRADEAITPLTHAIAADPKNGEAYRLRGTGYSTLYKNKQAIEDLQQAIQLNPEDFEAYFSLGVAYIRTENYQAAVDEFGKSIEHYKPKPGQEDQPFLQGYLTRAAAYIELGKAAKDPAAQKAAYQAAAAEAQKLVSQLDVKNPLHTKALAAALFSRGVAERMLGQLGTAIRTLTQAIELRSTAAPDDSTGPFLNDAYFRRGICFHLIGENKMAISDFQTAAHLVTDDPRANLWEGFTYAKLGDYHEAVRAYGDAIAASDRYTPAYYNRGLSYMMLGEYDKAIADFNDAIRLEPTKAEYYFKRGLAYQQLGNDQKASESFASAIEFDNKHAGAYRHMADVLQSLGRTELATQYRQKADQLTPPATAR